MRKEPPPLLGCRPNPLPTLAYTHYTPEERNHHSPAVSEFVFLLPTQNTTTRGEEEETGIPSPVGRTKWAGGKLYRRITPLLFHILVRTDYRRARSSYQSGFWFQKPGSNSPVLFWVFFFFFPSSIGHPVPTKGVEDDVTSLIYLMNWIARLHFVHLSANGLCTFFFCFLFCNQDGHVQCTKEICPSTDDCYVVLQQNKSAAKCCQVCKGT